ncbi:toll-like receptor 5 [Pangasianodon hypophthalmus]|uniref:toll-like receptor 5 n=1 Tax=Pangasianodon hypophthalmus TaxID=310915 RepID=UPI002307062F|nr:toll-like receptor 5 [Pangasianodon hypophthalmus]
MSTRQQDVAKPVQTGEREEQSGKLEKEKGRISPFRADVAVFSFPSSASASGIPRFTLVQVPAVYCKPPGTFPSQPHSSREQDLPHSWRGSLIRCLSMTSRSSFILPIFKLCICFLLTESTSRCFIKDNKAYCALRNLYEVPVLPPYITYLDLTLNYISEIHEKSFYGLEALQILMIQQQEIRLILRNNAFSRLSKLTKLDLAYNKNLQVDPGAFNGLFNLQILNLTECKLHDSILSGDYLRPLVSLEQLSLPGNNIGKIRPTSFFVNMSKLHIVDLSHNWINSFCEEDLFHFQGKHFTLLKLHDIKMFDMNPYWSGWNKCGNPFKNMSMTVLDLSLNGFSVDMAVLFFKAIRGTKIHILILNYSGSMGKGVWYNNMKDPDRNTFMDLAESGIKALDLSKASIFALKNSVFLYMPDLEEISLAHNSINQIERDAFYGLDNLRMLNLSHNLLDKIDSEMFNNLRSLETLDLSNNNIRILMSESFQGLPNLLHLFLSENSLQSLHTLANLPKLKVLYLDSNKIQSPYGLPSQARNITTIYLQYNRLSNAESFYTVLVEFPNIEVIYLGGNMFSWCVFNANYSVSPLNNVQFLDLHMTGLQNLWLRGQCLDMFDHLHKLQMLLLNNNFMQSLPENIFKGLTSLNYLDLSINSLTYIPNGIFPKSLRILNLAYNNLGSVDPLAFSTLTLISLLGNHFLCDCSLRDLQTWLNQTDVQMYSPAEELMCEFPEVQRGKPLLHAKLCEDEEDEKKIEELRLTLFICCTILIMLTTTGAIIFVRLRGYSFKLYRKAIVRFVEGGPKLPVNDGLMYDVYLCFSSNDIKWVTKALLKKLDTQFSDQNELRCCFEARDFIPGEDHLSNMRNAIWKSKKTLCILSREFFKDGWCLEAFSLAQTKMQKEVKDVLLVLLVDNIPHYKLMKYEPVRTYFQTRKYLCWPEDSQDLEWFYNHLKHSILKDTKVKQVKKDVETNDKATDCEAVTAF